MKLNPFQAFPESVEINGADIPIDADFRVGVAVEMEVLSEKPDVAGLLLLFYRGRIPRDLETALRRMMDFYSHRPEDAGEKPESAPRRGRWYDFEQDADALLASFQSAYRIDLSTAKLHWWAFRRLMWNLPAESPFMTRVRYRTADIKKLGKAEQKHYKKMRALFAIKQPENRKMTVEERDAAFLARLDRRLEEAKKAQQDSAR